MRADTMKRSAGDAVQLAVGVAASIAAAGCANKDAPAPAVHVAGSDEIRIGIVGCGNRGRGAAVQAVESAPNVRVTALANLFPDAIQTTQKVWADRPAKQYGVAREQCFIGFEACTQLLQTDANYILLTTPGGFRPAHMSAAIAAGKHVYLEKPIAVDPAGVRIVMQAGKLAQPKNLGILIGTWRRHDPGYIETVQRIRDGAIGKVHCAQLYCMNYGFGVTQRKPGWSDVEWQIRNFPYFTWLSGDFIVEHHIHQHDLARWVFGAVPRICIGMGGRQVRTDPMYGHIYDHFAVDYEFEGSVHAHSFCRQMESSDGRVGEKFIGAEGWADPAGRIVRRRA